MKTISAELAAHLSGNTITVATLWKVTLRSGTVFGFTDHDAPVTYSAVIYIPSSAYDASAIATRADLSVDNLSTVGLLDDEGITAADLEAGAWDGAQFELVRVNYADLSMGHEWLAMGELGNVQRSGGAYAAELRRLMHKLQNNLGRIVKPACDARLGDARCGVDIEALREAGTVASVVDNRTFGISVPDANFTGGVLTWTDGLNDGRSMEVKAVGVGDIVELHLPMPYDVEVGDGFTIVPGCDKTKTTCRDVYANVVNFRGFSFVPGTDQIMKIGSQ